MNNFKDLIVWQKAQDLAVEFHKNLNSSLPYSERNNMQDQIRRAVSSISANIAEGISRGFGPKDLCNFLKIARGSAGEVESFLLLAIKEEYFTEEQCERALNLCVEIEKMLSSMINKLRM